METVFAIIIGYLIGSVDFGVIVPRLLGTDIYEHGSGNPGTSNVFRTMGKGPAAAVLVGDMAKGLAAAAVGDLWVSETVGFAAGLAAVIGHVFPVWHRFRGGRGVATAIGTQVWLVWPAGLVLAVLWPGIVLTTKVASIASLVSMVLLVPLAAVFGARGRDLVLAGMIALVVVVRHEGNIRRIFSGSEREISR